MAWIDEVALPWTPVGQLFFSPIIGDKVYIIDQGTNFWLYDIANRQWTELTSPNYSGNNRANCYRVLAISPDSNRLACPSDGAIAAGGATFKATGGQRVEVYDIPTNTWVYASSFLPDIGGAGTPGRAFARSLVWADNDTLWVWAIENNGSASGLKGKCLKYVLSTDTWTQYINLTDFVSSSNNARAFGQGSAAIKSDESVVYGGGIDGDNKFEKYTVATDTYLNVLYLGNAFIYAYDRDKLWYYDDDGDCRQGYLNTADDAYNDDQFPENVDRTAGYGKYAGIRDSSGAIIAHARGTSPILMATGVFKPLVQTNPVTGVK